MANEVIKYHNQMNEVSFRKFTSTELDLFFCICYKLKEKKLDEITISFDELRKLINYKFTGNERFFKDLESMYDKLIQLNFKIGDKKKFVKFVLFTQYYLDSEEKKITITVNKKFYFILNELTKNFTRFELEEFTKLRSSYTKQMFKLLSQFKSTGLYIVSMENFRIKLDIPNSYLMHHIDKKVLKPIIMELSNYFKELKIEKIKKGRTIDKLKFTFQKKKEQTQFNKKGEKITFDLLSPLDRIKEIKETEEKGKLFDDLSEENKQKALELKKKLSNKKTI